MILKPMLYQVPDEAYKMLYDYLNILSPFIILIIISVLIGLIIDRISRDRVIKLFNGYWVVLFYEDIDKNGLKEAYFGKINIPPRSGGGFELEYALKTIVNPVKLLGYLKRMYEDTGNEKYIKKARELYDHIIKSRRINISFEEIKYDPFTEPSEASRKVYKDNIKDVYAIVRFVDLMSKEELERRMEELNKTFYPGTLYRIKRSITNFLGLAKDRLTEAFGTVSSKLSKVVPIPVEKEIKKTSETIVTGKLGSYEALLENSIGKLVLVKVKDIDGLERFYQGILREYSPNYIAVYNVDFRIEEEAVYIGRRLLDNYPIEKLDYHGWALKEGKHLDIISIENKTDKSIIKVKNLYNNNIYIDKFIVNNQEVKVPDQNLEPDETVEMIIEEDIGENPEIKVQYTIAKKSDIIWPTSKVRVIGSGEPSEKFIESILKKIMK